MSPMVQSMLLVASAFVLGELVLALGRSRGMPLPQALSMGFPRFVMAAVLGAAIGLVMSLLGIKVTP